MIKICEECDCQFETKPSIIKRGNGKFCSKQCFTNSSIKGEFKNCLICNEKSWKTLSQIKKSKSQTFFCSKACSISFRNISQCSEKHPNWKNGKASYRKRAIKKYGLKCSNENCIMKIDIPEIMYDVDHIDCDRENNKIENLQILCVWCHALKTRKVDSIAL